MHFRDMTKEQRDRAVLKALGALVVLVALFMFGLRPLLEQNRVHEQKIAELSDRIHAADRLIRRENQIRADAARLHESLRERFGAHLPPADNPLLWATQLSYRHAAAQGLEIRAITEETIPVPFWLRAAEPQRTAAAPGRGTAAQAVPWRTFAPYSVQIAVDAPFPEVLLLVSALEHEQPLLNISAISMQTDSRAPVDQSVRLSLQWPRLAVPLDPRVKAFLDEPFNPEAAP